MIYETLNSNTFLIELTPQEMADYEITYEILNSDEKTARGFIKSLLCRTDAGKRLTQGENLTVEALPNPEGGCFFLLTFTPPRVKYKVKKDFPYALELATADDLLDFILSLKKSRVKNLSLEIYEMDKKYFVLFSEKAVLSFGVISEYGKCSKISKTYLSEHGKSRGTVYLQ